MPLHLLIPLWAGQALFGWLIADLISGWFHWLEDRVWREDMPLIGRQIVVPNRLHHRAPLAFTTGSPWRRAAPTLLATLIISAIWLWITGPNLTWAFATLGGVLVNEVHCWAHLPARTPGVVRVLQEIGLVQSPHHHQGHHKAPSDRRYCILTDWLNPALDALRVWKRLEASLTVVGLEPNRGTA